MAGTVIDRQLSRPETRDRVRFVIATSKHDVAIRRLLRENPTAGAISLSFEREPDFFASANLAAERDDIILAFLDDRVVCMGRCVVRSGWIDGVEKRIGYLSELRLDHSVAGRLQILQLGYAFFDQCHRDDPADIYFTSIASDNVRARRLLERGVTGFPVYEFLSDYVTWIIPVPRRRRITPASVRCQRAELGQAAEIAAFLNQQAARHQLAPVWTTERLHDLVRHGLALGQFQLAYVGGELVACGAVWDQRAFRQTVIRGYTPLLNFTRPMLNLTARVFGKIELPPIGAVIAQAFASPLAVAQGHESALPELIASMLQQAAERGVRLLTFGFDPADPRLAIFQQHFSGRVYRTRLYRVRWPADNGIAPLDARRMFAPEVALL